jgi:putative Mn2+ efflux pump MntP
MDIIIVFIALGLAMDSFSVAITRGFTNPKTRMPLEALKVGCFFGLFQAIMPITGWLVGLSIIDLISGFDHWIAFGLLTFIGIRMIYESLASDALAVGLSLSFVEESIVTPAIIIGITTFSLSSIGLFLGKKLGNYFERIGVLGGIILIVIGVRILMEHLGVII